MNSQPNPDHREPTQNEHPPMRMRLIDERIAVQTERDLERRSRRRAVALQSLIDRSRAATVTAHLGPKDLQEARALHREIAQRVDEDLRAGAPLHRRVPLALRLLPLAVGLVDAAVLYAFCADLVNVAHDTWNFGSAVAAALALLGTVVAFTWLALTGTRLRDFRDRLGVIRWRCVDAATWAMLLLCLIIVAALAGLMYMRVLTTAAGAAVAYLPGEQIVPLAAVFAILSACANLAVLAVHALDGSGDAEQMRDLARALHAHDTAMARNRWLTGHQLGEPIPTSASTIVGTWSGSAPTTRPQSASVVSPDLEPGDYAA